MVELIRIELTTS